MQANGTFGNWLTFASKAEFKHEIENVMDVYSTSSNPDSSMDVWENTKEFESMRHFYSDTDRYVSSVLLSSLLNKNGILQINDTIYREGKYYLFLIIDGDTADLAITEDLINNTAIDISTLPANILVQKIYGITTSSDNAIAAGGGYNHSFTEASQYDYGSSTKFKLVAEITLASDRLYAEYSISTKFEKKTKNWLGNWGKWKEDWGNKLDLQFATDYSISNSTWSDGLYTDTKNLTVHGKKEIRYWFYWYNFQTDVINIKGIELISRHYSIRDNIPKTINIEKYNY